MTYDTLLTEKFNKMTYGFVGLGLIGSSIAKAFRRTYKDCRIIAFNRSEHARVLALQDKVADYATDSIDEHFGECDYIFLCTPVEYNEYYLRKLKSIIKPSCIITDVGSVKTNIHKVVIEEALEENFIGGHPMAGSEKTGYENGTASLCENALYAITPTALSLPEKVEEYKSLVEGIGAIPLILDYREHDYSVAAISHLPHIIASSLVNLVSDLDDEQETMRTIAAGGFKDITRIASSSPVMWQNICLSNQEQILKLTDCYIHALQDIRSSVADARSDDIISFFRNAKDYRDSITTPVRGSLQKNYSVYCDLVDEAGAIATLATIMASHNISIKNIGILHNREYEDGVLQIEFYEEDALEKAVKLMEDNHYVVHRR